MGRPRKAKPIASELIPEGTTVHRISRLSSRKGLPVEQRTEYLEILRFLCNQPEPRLATFIAEAICAPEKLVARRLENLKTSEAVVCKTLDGAVDSSSRITSTEPGYSITQYGRSCATGDSSYARNLVNSVFNLSRAL